MAVMLILTMSPVKRRPVLTFLRVVGIETGSALQARLFNVGYLLLIMFVGSED